MGARKLTHMKKELAGLRAEVGVIAQAQMQTEEKASVELAKCRVENVRLKTSLIDAVATPETRGRSADRAVKSPSPSPISPQPAPKRDSKRLLSSPHGQVINLEVPMDRAHFPAVRGASPSPVPQ